MRYSIILPAFAAAAFAQSVTLQTNSLGVVTNQPSPVTTQPRPVTTQPAAVTSQTTPAIVPAGQNSTFVTPVTNPSGVTSRASSATSANVTVVGTGSLRSTITGSAGGSSSRPPSSTSASSGSSRSGTATSSGSGSGTSSTAKPANAADIVQPVLGLGLAGVVFAAFL